MNLQIVLLQLFIESILPQPKDLWNDAESMNLN